MRIEGDGPLIRSVLKGHEPYEGAGGCMECQCGWPTREDFDAHEKGWDPPYMEHVSELLAGTASTVTSGVLYNGAPVALDGLVTMGLNREGDFLVIDVDLRSLYAHLRREEP